MEQLLLSLIFFAAAEEQYISVKGINSAADVLQKSRCVDAIVVGADRIAGNGATANKIGTYNLALSAFHHGIPFYVAALLTLVDLSLSSGDKIINEERSPK